MPNQRTKKIQLHGTILNLHVLFLKYLSIISFNLCFLRLMFCSSSSAKNNNRSPSFQVNMKGLDGILGHPTICKGGAAVVTGRGQGRL